MYPKLELAQLTLLACNKFNIHHIVISPGSRNAPLTIGFVNHPAMKTYSVVDERCAAFFALGMAQQLQQPVALVCTSGSALLNYYPAIAEAFYSNIPLVIISADRPSHLIDVGDGQAIRQENVYANHILFSANLLEEEAKKDYNTTLLVKALKTALSESGPVHINVPFNEPLYETVEALSIDFTNCIEEAFKKEDHIQEAQKVVNYSQFAEWWNASERKMMLIGVHFPSEALQEILTEYADDPSVLIFTETTSNVYHPLFVNSIDQLITPLTSDEFTKLRPDVLITLGGLVVSKRIKGFLRKYQPKHHWHIDEHTKLDTYFCLSEFVQEQPITFLKSLFGMIRKSTTSNYRDYWISVKEQREEKHENYLAKAPYSDLKVFETLVARLPDSCQLQLSNSSVVRYSQLFTLKQTLKVFCNRGTSGIDGSTSTAIGAAVAIEEPTVFITGDISFYYDSNALWNSYVPANFRIIIMNNSGGGIFKIIPGPKATNVLDYFETPHQLTAEHLAKTYGFEYCSAKNMNELQTALVGFYKESKTPRILEVFTPSDSNDEILRKYFKSL